MTSTAPYEQWTVEKLRDELRSRRLSTAGSKADLVERLSADDRPAEDLTVAELKDELRDRDLPTSGTKDELVDRLEDADADAATDDDDEATDPEWPRGVGECVVDDGTAHTGRATPGAKICSAHAMHYKADGTPRE